MKIVSVTWNSYIPTLLEAADELGIELEAYYSKILEENPEEAEKVLSACEQADAIFIYHIANPFWEEFYERLEPLKTRIPVICVGSDPSSFTLSSVKLEIAATCFSYIIYGGKENFGNMLCYISKEVCGAEIEVKPPEKIPWDGLYHPDAREMFSSLREYLNWYGPRKDKTVGLLISRTSWVNNDLEIEKTLIRDFETLGLSVIPVFAYSLKDKELGSRGMNEVIEDYFMENGKPVIDSLVKLSPFFIMSNKNKEDESSCAERGVELLQDLDVPVFQPVISHYVTLEQWQESKGLSTEIGWGVALPEFEGVIEPIIIGAGKKEGNYIGRAPIQERCSKLAARVLKWINLRKKPVNRRKIAFILHNRPCTGVEGSVGDAANLDSLESVARILNRMQEAGYAVNSPLDGRELIETILNRKAISEFRWTPINEIVKNGGVLAFVEKGEYEQFFNTLSPNVRQRMIEGWGNPPGEEVNGIPAAMVYENKIVVTGVQYGNAVVCVQPKRGCAGARCDGKVCKILHDPDVPPTHQYLATYRYLENTFGADVLVHVGTHGTLEFLPGKGVGLSGDCYPDIGIGTIPHLYIYNSDNPPEGTIAKRRSLACLIDHMQTVMTSGGLYGSLEELDRLLGEYEQVKYDKGRAHALKHLILDEIKKSNLDSEIKADHQTPFEEIIRKAHEALGKIRNSQIHNGMHIFGQLPEGEKKVEFINSILRYDDQESVGNRVSIRRMIAGLLGLDLDELISDQSLISANGKSNGQRLEEIDSLSKDFIRTFISNPEKEPDRIIKEVLSGQNFAGQSFEVQSTNPTSSRIAAAICERILDLESRIDASLEIEALLHGFEGGYIPAGPSGLIMRGRDDVLPTGRNFYSLDPKRVPTKAAWRVGQQLSGVLIDKHLREEGRYPENVAFYWMANDIMWADGEGMAQIMSLLGVEPLLLGNGRLKGFSVIPLEELGRPRIDVTIRISGILRDNFPNCLEVIDEAIQAVASLDEPEDMNYPRKHSHRMIEEGADSREATLRIFSSKPGTYSAGVQLAVYASAWKDEKDLADIFLYWNGYAYGKDVKGQEAHTQLASSLKTVDATFNKVVSDEYDLLGCCCYFGVHGGLTAAAKQASGRDVKVYFGDTREPQHVEVRDMADELRRVVRTRLLNPKWIEGMRQHGYKGAQDISKRVGRVYGWEASTQEVDDWIFDDITKAFVLDEEMRRFFEKNNPYALEEMSRRLLEAQSRGLWNPDPQVFEDLKNSYLEIESWMEELAGEGEFQGGAVDIMSFEDVPDWDKKMQEIRKILK
ncbi:cobalt chelatase [Methanosarcina sp. 2.H.T.1A.6]|uniref:cobaltochelatase subunit CobN n=1 Tax=unclassified Methanosarcina TaxID=2644672 RepID=UPI0006222549|nr:MULTISPECIES: cobaltochelatase subunit CobN [unclassified Methanosarcina]KKG12250.1 cobalt chelatase [Methanosarcina sp. 2.H.T.1A.15]KKG13651.1 cobalt chelatase [Methanosarcina sp. 2.H.T.1A.3]KKG24879.1 cobalt chelatase [Methanosarcina sp. 2.H.T.1A.6]KKG26002.1 cobalt chelatase [Methanosarcina sp. 2.H.T.1A.8]